MIPITSFVIRPLELSNFDMLCEICVLRYTLDSYMVLISTFGEFGHGGSLDEICRAFPMVLVGAEGKALLKIRNDVR